MCSAFLRTSHRSQKLKKEEEEEEERERGTAKSRPDSALEAVEAVAAAAADNSSAVFRSEKSGHVCVVSRHFCCLLMCACVIIQS